jgi:hypothetical protein
MQALTLDYVRGPKATAVSLAILIFAVLIVGCFSKTYFDLAREKKHWQTQWSVLQQQQKSTRSNGMSAEEKAGFKPEFIRANEMVRQLSVPWDELFKAVEATSFDDVALLSIQPDASKQSLTLTAEAKDFAGMLEYVRRLGQEPLLADVQLTNHHLQQQDPQKPVRFVVMMNWTVS